MLEDNYRIDSPLSAFDYSFHTPLSVDDCIERISRLPCEFLFKDIFLTTVLWYKCEAISQNCLLITFTGGTFRRPRHTQYVANFYAGVAGTIITMHFHREWLLYPLPIKFFCPFTATQEIEALMKQKLSAERTN